MKHIICKCETAHALLRNRGGDSASNPRIVPPVEYIFGCHNQFFMCLRCIFFTARQQIKR